MSRDKGNRAAGWVADWLATNTGWVTAEKTPNGRPGADITGTPGVAFEVKTGPVGHGTGSSLTQFTAQAARNAGDQLPAVVYLPPGVGENSPDRWLGVLPWPQLVALLTAAGYAPPIKEG